LHSGGAGDGFRGGSGLRPAWVVPPPGSQARRRAPARPSSVNWFQRIAMATTTRLLTWQEFEQLPDEHLEIIEGELIILPPPKFGHSIIAARIVRRLEPLEEKGLGGVYQEVGYKLSEDPASWIQPDISFLKMQRVHATGPDQYANGAPELAVEVVSTSETV